MNWYKIAQYQQIFNFIDPSQKSFDFITPNDKINDQSLEGLSLNEALEYASSDYAVFEVLKYFKIPYEIIDFSTGKKSLLVEINRKPFVIDLGKNTNYSYEAEDANKWIRNIVDYGNVYKYITQNDFNQEFWDGIGEGYKLYHGTTEENVENILKNGLETTYGTRGIENRNTGAAVFTSDEIETAKYYYDYIIEIDVGAMKSSGYMPRVSREEPIEEAEMEEALAHKIGLDEYYVEYETGLDPGTVIFYDTIPPQFLKLLTN
jgi:hypothetical protein